MTRKNIKAPVREEKESSLKKKIIVTVILIGLAFSGAFLIYFVMQIGLNTETPMVVVVSGSMEPNLYRGDLLFLRGKDGADIQNGTIEGKEGDIIVFNAHGIWSHPPTDPIVHRVIDKWYVEGDGWYFRTKGDANALPDSGDVPESHILGVVVGRIPYIGWVKIALTESGLLIPLLVIVSILLVASIMWDLFKKDKDEKKDAEESKIYDATKVKREIELDFTKIEGD
ncbi:MAG: signal peptidase I [Promethearchaeota archaeon]|jgi:signal peptidase